MKCCRFGARSVYTIQPCPRLQCHFIQINSTSVTLCVWFFPPSVLMPRNKHFVFIYNVSFPFSAKEQANLFWGQKENDVLFVSLHLLHRRIYSVIPVNMPDPIRIRSGSAGKNWPEAGRMILAHWLASGPDPFDQNLTQSARTKSHPRWFCTILSGTSAEERNRV